jgi:hypothetical protein
MRVIIITKKQEARYVEQKRKDAQTAFDRALFVGRCLAALREARALLAGEAPGVIKDDVIHQIDSLLVREHVNQKDIEANEP